MESILTKTSTSFSEFKEAVLQDFKLINLSREASIMGRREVLSGKAKFGIFGDGKELAQVAMAKVFQNGDFRSGYYRDQTFMMAIDQLTVEQYFSGLYAHVDENFDPMSAGRQMGGHFATWSLDDNGNWKNLTEQKNSSSDISPTAGQMARLVGLAQASKVYKAIPELADYKQFSNNGSEVAFGTIGDASTSEGQFWEAINAMGVLQVPVIMSVWDDGYGISVPRKYQTTKDSISEALSGFQRTKDKPGYEILKVKGWDYPSLLETYQKANEIARNEHVPVLVHVVEVTQPQGHSTSGSHERYKSKERLEWEVEYDPINQFRKWILSYENKEGNIATPEELDAIQKEAKTEVRKSKSAAWKAFESAINEDKLVVIELLNNLYAASGDESVNALAENLKSAMGPIRKDIFGALKKAIRLLRGTSSEALASAKAWLENENQVNYNRYSEYLYSVSEHSPMNKPSVPPILSEENVDGRIVIRENFRVLFKNDPRILTFGEDTGKIGGVNQGMEGMQEEFGNIRVSDTGIRENTIIGQGIGMSMRGLRPIAEIQYLDYLLYGLQPMSDDLATVRYRSNNRQQAPLIVRTRGHRLEGIWHSGSPMGMILNSLRGVHVCVPRNMTKAAGFYNLLLQSDDPALVIEPLNGYRSKEVMPTNLGEFTTPLGIPEIVKTGTDVTVVSYGSTFNLCELAIPELEEMGVSVELIDAQSLLPFDINGMIADSLKKTNKLVVIDEDVSSGATAYILDQVLVKQEGFQYLDAQPVTIAAKDHRPPYGSDGDYFSKPSVDDIVESIYKVMNEYNPSEYPSL